VLFSPSRASCPNAFSTRAIPKTPIHRRHGGDIRALGRTVRRHLSLPLFLQDLMGRTEIDTGLLLLPGALVMGLVMLVSGRIADRFGTRASTIVGLALIAWFMWTYRRLDTTTSTWAVLYPTLIRGVGLGLLVTPVMTAAINAVPTAKAGMASSMLSLISKFQVRLASPFLPACSAAERPSTSRWWVKVSLARDRRSWTPRALLFCALSSWARLPRWRDCWPLSRRAQDRRAASVLAFNDAFLVGAGIVGAGAIPALFLASTSKARERGVPAPAELVE